MVVVYKTPRDEAAFKQHYFDVQVPLAKQLPGLRRYETSVGPIVSMAGASDAFFIATLHFDSLADIRTAFGTDCGRACAQDRRLLAPGDRLVATHRDFKGKEAILTADGAIQLDGKRYTSPSAAGHSLRKRATNGWYFWATSDGRRPRDVRTEFQNAIPVEEQSESEA